MGERRVIDVVNKKIRRLIAVLSCVFLLITLSACSSSSSSPSSPTTSSQLVVSYIDVGQGLSVLVQFPNGKNMLYDAGPNQAANTIISYLKSHSVSEIDALVLSHPDSDHIGAADEVIESFTIGSFYMPKVVHSTQSYLDVLSAAKAKKLTIKTAQKGVTISLDPDVKVTMWGPVKDYEADDTNNWSAVVSISYGTTSFLLTGDAEQKAEADMINAGVVEPQTVLQVGHHGSKYSTSTEFISAVQPAYAVISVGENSYGHPAQETLSRLQTNHVKVFRTDTQGTVVAQSDGSTTTWNVEPVSLESNSQTSQVTPVIPAPTPTPAPASTPTAESKPQPEPKPTTTTAQPNDLPKVSIISKDLVGEKVVIKNNDTVDIDMSGWELVSVKGNQIFKFPDGFILKKGQTVTITSGPEAYDDPPKVLKWPTGNVWNNGGDPAELRDNKGRVVSSIP